MTDILNRADALIKTRASAALPYTLSNRVFYAISHSPCYASNGYAIRTDQLSTQLNRNGFDTIGFVRQGRPWNMVKQSSNTPVLGRVNGVPYVHTPWKNSKRPNTEMERFNQMVATNLEQMRVFKPSVVLAASNHDVALPALVAAKQLGLPFFYEVRGFWEISERSRSSSTNAQRTTDSPDYDTQYQREVFVCQHAEHIFTLNQAMASELMSRGVPAGKIDLVPNSIDSASFSQLTDSSRKRRGEKEHTLGYVGSLSEYEGVELAIAAVAKLKSFYPLTLYVVGGSGSSVSAKAGRYELGLHKLATDQGVSKQVVFTGRVSQDEARRYYRDVDTLIMPRQPTLVSELVSGLKPVEYMATGKSIIASDIAPNSEIFANGERAWLFKKGSIDSLAETLEQLLNSTEEQRQRKISAALEAVQSDYSWERTIKPIVRELKKKCG